MPTNKAYWMLADTELPIAREPLLKSSFEAHFKHGLLFNEHLMISDAQAVNCVNLRTLVKDDSSFRELMRPELISIATRDPSGSSVASPLTQVRDAFHKERKHHMDSSRFLIDSDLELLDDNCQIVPYTYSALRKNYTDSIFNIFKGHTATKLFGENIQELLVERLMLEAERDNGLGRVFLHKNFEDDLRSIGRHELWAKYSEDIIKLSDAPYVTGIPQVLNTSPIYSPVHQESFQLAYPRTPTVIEAGEKLPIATSLNLSSYEDALSKLQPNDILFLRDSYEFKQYQSYISSGVSHENQLNNAWDSLVNYQELIDEYIIKRHLGIKTSKQFKGKRYIEPIRKISQEGIVYSLGLALSGPVGAAALSLANFFISDRIEKSNELLKKQIARETYKLKTQLENRNAASIKAEQVTKSRMNETIYSSVQSE